MRTPFDSIFIQYADGTIEPRKKMIVRGVELGPGVRFSRGTSIGGIDFVLFKDRDVEIEDKEDVIIFKGIYQ